MAKDELTEDLEKLEYEYETKISRMSMKLRKGEYKPKCLKKVTETLAGYMSAQDKLKKLRNVFYEMDRNGTILGTYPEHLSYIRNRFGGE